MKSTVIDLIKIQTKYYHQSKINNFSLSINNQLIQNIKLASTLKQSYGFHISPQSVYTPSFYLSDINMRQTVVKKSPRLIKQAAWVLKCQCLIKQNYIDELQTEEDGIAEQLIQQNQTNKLARVGTSFKAGTSSNPIMRPMNTGRVNTGFQRIGTSAASRSGSRAGNGMLRTGRIMTRNGVPATSNGRVLRLSTASLQMHGQNFFDSSKIDLRKVAKRKSKARLIFQYLFCVQHNLKKALQLAVYATQANNYEDPWWKLALGKCYYFLSFYPEAEKQFLSSQRHNNNIDSFLYLSRIYQKQDNVQKSLSILKTCRQSHPFQSKSTIFIARIHTELNDLEKAIEQYKGVLALENCNIEALASFASSFYYKDSAQISVKLYQRLIQLGYDSAQVWNNLAICCISTNQFQLFYKCFERALNLGKDDPIIYSDIWYNIGYTYVLIGEWELALEAYKISLEYFPENIESMNNIGVIESKTNIETAINWCQKSFKEFQNFQAAFNLSIWYFQISNYEKSYFYNQQSLKLYPQHAESVDLYSQLLMKLDKL